jgi:glutaredoxin-related protein
VPEVEQQQPRFRAAHTQVLGVSVDSIFCHAGWGQSLGGISFPLLADFHPKGETARAYGLYLDEAGITDRATVIIDAGGTVRHASSVTPAGRRDIAALAAFCEEVDANYGPLRLPDASAPEGLGMVDALFVKSSCGHSLKVLLARDNLHLEEQVPVKNVTEDPSARAELKRLVGKDQAPCLVVDGKPLHGADEIVDYFVRRTSDFG